MTTFLIDIQNDHDYLVSPQRLEAASVAVLKRHDVDPNSSLSIVITDNDTVQALNQQHRGVDAPTDVLSFPADKPPIEIPEEPPYLGDLLIAYPYAAAQAAREKHVLLDSFDLLVVHGTLHLLGYDHDTPENRAEMWAIQAEVLRELNIDTGIVPSLEESDH
jgi:probable rRNA maturation factor